MGGRNGGGTYLGLSRSKVELSVAGAAHVSMEPDATLAYWEDRRPHVVTGTQTPFNVRRDLAARPTCQPTRDMRLHTRRSSRS